MRREEPRESPERIAAKERDRQQRPQAARREHIRLGRRRRRRTEPRIDEEDDRSSGHGRRGEAELCRAALGGRFAYDLRFGRRGG